MAGTDPTVFNGAHRGTCTSYFAAGGPGGMPAGPNSDYDLDGLTAAFEMCIIGTSPFIANYDGAETAAGDCLETYDVNGNGLTNASDRTIVLRAANLIDVGDMAAEDVNGNGIANASDGTLILRAANAIDPCL
jgi:hypothetical protein